MSCPAPADSSSRDPSASARCAGRLSCPLPVSLEEIEITEEQWEECETRIPDMSDVAHYPYRVTKEMLDAAMARLRERAAQE